jgi:transcriptional regulator with XRE-family HTH domain
MLLTAEQVRAARALLGWSQPQLAEATGLSMSSVRRIETPGGPAQSRAGSLEAVRATFEREGVVFLGAGEMVDGGPGVRFRDKNAD